MNQSSLDLLALQLAAHLDCTQDAVCQHIMQIIVETGQPLSLMHLARRLRMSQEKLAAHLVLQRDFGSSVKLMLRGHASLEQPF